jgi:hypothetical protein
MLPNPPITPLEIHDYAQLKKCTEIGALSYHF